MHLLMEPPADAIVTPAVFMAFDCLYTRVKDVRGWPSRTGARSWRTRLTARRFCPPGAYPTMYVGLILGGRIGRGCGIAALSSGASGAMTLDAS
jgi:hypothetical protein